MVIEMSGHTITDEMVNECYRAAERALNCGEVPVGCVFVHFGADCPTGAVVASAHNQTNSQRNATRHAEMECIDELVRKYGSDLKTLHALMADTTVLITLEPCLMCVRALRHLRVRQVLFGARNERFGGTDSVYNVSANELIDEPVLHCHQLLDADKAVDLLQRFYQQTNDSAPKPHRKRLKT